MRKTLAFLTLLVLCAASLQAQVKVVVRPDGQRIMLNESVAQRALRFAQRLMAAPVRLARLIERHSDDRGLDPRLVRAVIQVESGYNARALSNHGAMGLMQLLPETAQDLSVRDPYDVDENVRGGTSYLRQLLDLFDGRLDYALAGYNAGPGAVQKYKGVPPYGETIDYVRQVMSLYRGEEAGALSGARVLLTRDAQNRILLSNAPR